MSNLTAFLKKTPLRFAYHKTKQFLGTSAQSNEHFILKKLAIDIPQTFIEFGFHPSEYNCIGLEGFRGYLIDGDRGTVELAKKLIRGNVEVHNSFITLENIGNIVSKFDNLGVLSIDVDGNDYWFLEASFAAKPEIICIEYNASFGLRPITVPYDPSFSRHEKHNSGWYHGASLTALVRLAKKHGYKAIAVSNGGGNLFLMPDTSPHPEIDPEESYLENTLRNKWSKTNAREQWDQLSHLPYVKVDN